MRPTHDGPNHLELWLIEAELGPRLAAGGGRPDWRALADVWRREARIGLLPGARRRRFRSCLFSVLGPSGVAICNSLALTPTGPEPPESTGEAPELSVWEQREREKAAAPGGGGAGTATALGAALGRLLLRPLPRGTATHAVVHALCPRARVLLALIVVRRSQATGLTSPT